MKKNIIRFFAAVMLMSCCTAAMAQTALRSSYFSDNSILRHELNPAFTPERNYFTFLPVLSGTNVTMHSNINLADIIYPQPNGKLATFMSSDVSNSFLNNLSTNNNVGMDLDLNILQIGFRGLGGFNTIGVALRCNNYINLPKGLFEFMKMSQSGASQQYSFDNLGIESNAYMEIALGHQHKINDNWSVGGKLKLLLGVEHISMSVDNMTMNLSGDEWRINANGELNMALKGLSMPTHNENHTTKPGRPEYNNSFDFSDMDFDSPGLGGFGLAVDLGVNYKAEFLEGLELSAAVLNLGYINYSNCISGAMNNTQPWTFKGFTICSNENKPGHEGHETFEDQADRLGQELGDYLNFKKTGDGGSKSQTLGATLNIGASYTLPMYNRLKFGFLSSTRIYGAYSWSEGRFSANINPVKGLDLGINYAVSSWGSSFGWLVNYTGTGFSLYFGMDHTLGDVTKQYIPLSGNANVAFGISFPLTGKKG